MTETHVDPREVGRFTLSKKEHRRYLVIELEGDLDSYTGDILLRELQELPSGGGCIIIRCRRLNSITPSGVGVLLRGVECLQGEAQGSRTVLLTELSPAVKGVFDSLSMGEVFTICSRMGEAKRLLRKPL